MRKVVALAVMAWYFVAFAPDGQPTKLEFKDFYTCHYFKTYAQIKAGEGGLQDGATTFPPGYLPNVAGCYWETDGPSVPAPPPAQ